MRRVLVADDTKNIRVLVGKCLQLEGYEVAEAVDGTQALDMMRKVGYALAFLDIKMPGMSGTEVLKAARAAGVNTPVIIITAYATVKNAVECTQLGAVAYLHKPFTADKLRNVLAELHSTDGPAEAEKLMSFGRVQEAVSVLKKALPDNPLNARIYALLAEASDLLGQTDDAMKYRGIAQSLGK